MHCRVVDRSVVDMYPLMGHPWFCRAHTTVKPYNTACRYSRCQWAWEGVRRQIGEIGEQALSGDTDSVEGVNTGTPSLQLSVVCARRGCTRFCSFLFSVAAAQSLLQLSVLCLRRGCDRSFAAFVRSSFVVAFFRFTENSLCVLYNVF